MAIQSRVGFELVSEFTQSHGVRLDEYWFGESATRIIVAVGKDQSGSVIERCRTAGIPAARLGTAGGSLLRFPGIGEVSLDEATERFESALE